ncbi:MAG: excinuclease ABC subunit A [Acidobacteria bacterium 13_1_20CM_2_57_8]|nr:MAG: excinuclease ABC subunit A [Acidobacteria bacterium 13_1_20CM_2_57_8]
MPHTIENITVRGARQHNLKSIDVEIPRNRLTVITGLSGSGKSSLAFDTLYAEGQRRYVESLSAYARQFLDRLEPPDVDSIEGLSPAISIEQKTATRSPRSTVGTVTEIYDYLRLLFSSIGIPHCFQCGKPISKQTPDQIVRHLKALPEGERVMILAPIVRGRKGEFKKPLQALAKTGYVRGRIDGVLHNLDEPIELDKKKNHSIEIVVDRLMMKKDVEKRLEASIEQAIKLAKGIVLVAVVDGEERLYSEKMACVDCGVSIPTIEPRTFSFNSIYGACEVCNGLGMKYDFDPARIVSDPARPLLNGGLALANGWFDEDFEGQMVRIAEQLGADLSVPFEQLPAKVQNAIFYGIKERGKRTEGIIDLLNHYYDQESLATDDLSQFMVTKPCAACRGARLRPESLAVKVADRSIAEMVSWPINDALKFFADLKLGSREELIAGRIIREIRDRLEFLDAVGLNYLSLDRTANTLSGGESQRIRLATQIGSKLRGVLYVLDEPSIGLHHKDNARLLATLEELRNLGNTVVVVEHDEETIRRADYVIDLGPGAGTEGGNLVASGSPETVAQTEASLTGHYLSGRQEIPVPHKRRLANGKAVVVRGASEHNLQNIDVSFPVGLMTVVTGVSGSGKSTLVNEILYKALAHNIYRALDEPGAHKAIEGLEFIDKVIEIDQSPIGRTPRSNPATYTGVFTPIRELYAMLPESRARGYKAGRFSFNVKGGRCEACQGDGLRKIEMSFLPNVYVSCEVCRGKRYNSETLAIQFKGLSIADLLNSTVADALNVLGSIPQIHSKLQTLVDVGLGYIGLGQPATTLSGGEAQRIKLAKELSRRATGKTLYILDEPTTGLHFDDVKKLLDVLCRLTDLGNTVIIIEHHLDVIKTADWVIDLGPDGGVHGGRVMAAGTPEQVARSKKSLDQD